MNQLLNTTTTVRDAKFLNADILTHGGKPALTARGSRQTLTTRAHKYRMGEALFDVKHPIHGIGLKPVDIFPRPKRKRNYKDKPEGVGKKHKPSTVGLTKHIPDRIFNNKLKNSGHKLGRG